jgi:carboxyl-terminal processing protease
MKNNGRGLLIGLLVLVLLVGAFLGGGVAGWFLNEAIPADRLGGGSFAGATPTPLTSQAQEEVPEELRAQFQIFWQVWDLLEQSFYDPSKIDYQKMTYGAIKGMVDSVGDDYTLFYTPAETGVSTTHLQGDYEGIGAYISEQDGYAVIQGPVNDETPAAKAGLRQGDIVIEVDGISTEGMVLEEVISHIKGPAGTDVVIKIYRPDEQREFDVTITRTRIEIKSAEGEMRDDGIAYVRISVFGETTADELDATLEELLQQNPRGLIVDLRGNGGGYLRAAQEILGRFLRSGDATLEEDRDGNRTALPVIHGAAQVYDLPMVVLVDGGSASASEITAGALQDYGRAILVGEQSFGKGSIQNVIPLDDGSSVRITIAHWLTPDGRQIQDVGLTPDLIVTRTPEDYDAGLDPQLDTAAAYLLGNPLPPVAVTPTPKP